MSLKLGFQIVLSDHADELVDQLSLFKKEQGRDRPDIVLRCHGSVLVHVDFGNLDLPSSSPASSSRIGESLCKVRTKGPKSTSTGTSAALIASLKVCSLSVVISAMRL